ncbi:hypothetical protein ACFUJX_22175 [Streptomyces rubiginosohelvolus]|uniref:hypothetical protein n=1 Tax=Streptomyces rubiginosohelvolus TaxID=67362 RepID=UPI00362877BB
MPNSGPAPSTEPSSTIASPLTLILDETRNGGQSLEEALFLSFTADFGFFEEVALGVTQSTGARVTVVGDVGMARSDPRAVRRAGRSYLAGLAYTGGPAFHPKMVVLAGQEHATIALGSGNTTLAGWQSNAELWTVLRVLDDRSPAAVLELAAWLRDLPEEVKFSAHVPQALRRVAALLERLHRDRTPVDRETRVVSSLHSPILSQLPNGPVDELAVFAPFHDRQGRALGHLLDRLRPSRFTLTYQPGLTDLDGQSVAGLVQQYGGRIISDDGQRYRHGKLVEWVAEGRRWALTGSPNLSSAALLLQQGQGGNCELGIITPSSASLLPDGTEQPVTRLRAAPSLPRPQTRSGPLLLGAVRVADGLEISLARPLPVISHVELSAAEAPPEQWERLSDLAPGQATTTMPVLAAGGSRVRLVTVDDSGVPNFGNIVFVVDVERVLRRSAPAPSQVPSAQPLDLFTDVRLAERFLSDLESLRTVLQSASTTAPAVTSTPSMTVPTRAPDDKEGWERYLDECAGRIGTPLVRFALGLPLPAGVEEPFQDLLMVAWDERFTDDIEAALDEDDAESVAAGQDTEPLDSAQGSLLVPDLRQAGKVICRKYQRWVEDLVTPKPQKTPLERMLAVRLTLWTVAAGAWPPTDTRWLPLLAGAVRAMDGRDVPTRIEPEVGSLAAVALAVLRSCAPRYEVTSETLIFNETSATVGHLLPAADAAYIAEYASLLGNAFGLTVAPENVLSVAGDIVQDDPLDDAVSALAERGRDVHRHGRLMLHAVGRFSNPALVALEAIGAAEEEPLVGAWATGGPHGERWALAIWRRPDLVIVDAAKAVPLWRHYRLAGLVGPRALAAQRSFESAVSVPHGPRNQSFDLASQVLAELGLSECQPPRCGPGV